MISKGLLGEAKAHAMANVELLAKYAAQGIPIVGCEPSCILTFRDEYPDLLDDPRAQDLARQSVLIEEFLLRLHQQGKLELSFANGDRSLLLHGHCHQKAHVARARVCRPSGFCPARRSRRWIRAAAAWRAPSATRRSTTRCPWPSATAASSPPSRPSAGVGGRGLRRLLPPADPHGTGGRRARHLVEVLADALSGR